MKGKISKYQCHVLDLISFAALPMQRNITAPNAASIPHGKGIGNNLIILQCKSIQTISNIDALALLCLNNSPLYN